MHRTVPLIAVLAMLLFSGSAQTSPSASPDSTQVATWKVLVGEQTKPPAGTPKGTTLNDFFPGALQVNAGDKVTFQSSGFHTVTYLGTVRDVLGFIPDPAKSQYEGINDGTGEPFYFNGLRKFIFDAAAFGPYGPKVISGKTKASSGVIAPGPNGKPVSATFSFPKAGNYPILCAIHPGMKMKVTVKAAGAAVPSAEEVAATAKAETQKAWAKAKPLAATKVPANTVFAGVGAETTILGFFPKQLRVKAGTTVSFVIKSPSEPHNPAFGPKKYLEQFGKQNEFFPMGPKGKNQVSPAHAYGTEPAGGYKYDGQNHGNGFLVAPLRGRGLFPGPVKNVSRITFTAPGKFHYICFLHGPDMSGDIVVTR